jgi:hypothetical protein
MPGDLQQESSVAPLVQQDTRMRPLHRQAAEHEWTGRKPEGLGGGFALLPNQLDHLGPTTLLLGYNQVGMSGAEDGSGAFQTSRMECS